MVDEMPEEQVNSEPEREMWDRVIHGDCLAILKRLPDNSVDAIVTDPPAGIGFMMSKKAGRTWDSDKGGRDQWIAWLTEIMAECLRVIRPGGHALIWSLPRTSHWTGMALEDAGWEVRDCIYSIQGAGFPKSLDVGKAVETEIIKQLQRQGIEFTGWEDEVAE